jgi:hypothetical protein
VFAEQLRNESALGYSKNDTNYNESWNSQNIHIPRKAGDTAVFLAVGFQVFSGIFRDIAANYSVSFFRSNTFNSRCQTYETSYKYTIHGCIVDFDSAYRLSISTENFMRFFEVCPLTTTFSPQNAREGSNRVRRLGR